MTTTIRVTTNGNYVSTVKINGDEAGSVGPGSMVFKDFNLPHNDGGPSMFEVSERQATADEVDKAAQARVDGATAGG